MSQFKFCITEFSRVLAKKKFILIIFYVSISPQLIKVAFEKLNPNALNRIKIYLIIAIHHNFQLFQLIYVATISKLYKLVFIPGNHHAYNIIIIFNFQGFLILSIQIYQVQLFYDPSLPPHTLLNLSHSFAKICFIPSCIRFERFRCQRLNYLLIYYRCTLIISFLLFIL